jgi:hypothetical protein
VEGTKPQRQHFSRLPVPPLSLNFLLFPASGVCVCLAVPLERVQLFFKNELAHLVGLQEPTQPEILLGLTVRLGMQLQPVARTFNS